MKKKYFISADIEGITDVTSWEEASKGSEGYAAAQMQMCKEVAAACQAIVDEGYEVVVRDGHGSARNLIHDMLPKETILMRGWACHPGSMMAMIDDTFDGAIYVGYHAPAGSDGNPLAHTLSYSKISYIKINNELASEFTLNSLYAAQFKVPSIFISGDKTICQFAQKEIPKIIAVSVKEGHGNSTINIHPQQACELIYSGVKKAIKTKIPVRNMQVSYEIEVGLKTHQAGTAAANIEGVEAVNINAVRFSADSPTELNIMIDKIKG